MKKTVFMLAAIAALLMSCEKNESEDIMQSENPGTPAQIGASDYTGTVTVVFQGQDYDNDSIKVSFTPNEQGDSASISIYKIRFVPQMPVTIDITIPGITVNKTDGKITITGDSIIPQALGGNPYPRYIVTGFNGEINDSVMTFALKFGDYPTSYQGSKNE